MGDSDPELIYRDAMLQDIGTGVKARGDVDAILVTGDIAYRGHPDEYEAATAWFEEVASVAGCPKGRIYVVPGNHDVDRSIIESDDEVHDAQDAIFCLDTEQAKENELGIQLRRKESAAALFRPVAAYNDMARHYDCQIYPERVYWDQWLRIDEYTVLRLRGLTSTLLSGVDGDDQERVTLFMGAFQLSVGPKHGVINLVMAHHPPDWMFDQATIETRLLGAPNIVLFGHKHRQQVRRDVDGCMMFSAGSVNPDRYEQGWVPAYNFIRVKINGNDDRRRAEIRVWQREWQENPNGFRSKMNIGKDEDYFDHQIMVNGHSKEEETSVGTKNAPVEGGMITIGDKDGSPDLSEVLIQGPAERHIIDRFWDLGSNKRRQVMIEIGEIGKSDVIADELKKYHDALMSIAREERVGELVKIITAKEAGR